MMCPLGDDTGYFIQAGSGGNRVDDSKGFTPDAATGAGGHGATGPVSRGGGGSSFCRLKYRLKRAKNRNWSDLRAIHVMARCPAAFVFQHRKLSLYGPFPRIN